MVCADAGLHADETGRQIGEGTVGLNWQFAGIAPIHAAGASDLALRNINTAP